MKKSTLIGISAAASVLLATAAFGKDPGSQDVLKLSQPTFANGKYTVSVHVTNDQCLTAFDIPLRFGQPGDPINLVSVDFTDRVADWDFTNAQVDNDAKTVILGMIAVVGRMDESADLAVSSVGNTAIANLGSRRLLRTICPLGHSRRQNQATNLRFSVTDMKLTEHM